MPTATCYFLFYIHAKLDFLSTETKYSYDSRDERVYYDRIPNLKGSLSKDDGKGNENVISKYKFTLL